MISKQFAKHGYGITLAVNVDAFVGDSFGAAVFVTPVVVEVFGFNVVERTVDVAGADLTRDVAVDDVVEVVVFVALTRDAVLVLVAGLLTVLKIGCCYFLIS